MAIVTVDPTRDIIPRWRDFRTTAALGELDSTPESRAIAHAPVFTSLESKIFAWRTQKGFGEAADLINNAYLLKSYDPSVLEAVEFLRSQPQSLSPPLQRIVEEIYTQEPPQKFQINLHTLNDDTLIGKIHAIKKFLNDQPRNSILYVELARLYTLLSQENQAKEAMLRAVKLSPDNRFILRSAARLFLHIGQKRLAHDILRYANRTKHDSWLLAAEISVASAVGHRPRFLKNGETMVRADISPGQLTELATAVAMEEIEHGKNAKARKLINVAMIEPNENSIAQIAWASRNKIRLVDFDSQKHGDTPLLHESNAWQAFQDERWDGVISESLLWHEDQVFSSRPILLASYVAATLQCDYTKSAQILEIGRKLNPKSSLVLNNLAFAYASNNQPDLAEEMLDASDYRQLADRDKIYHSATRGLVAFRKGNLDLGRALYEKAINDSRDTNNPKLALRAGIYRVREEIRINPASAKTLVPDILKLCENTKDRELILIAKSQLPTIDVNKE